MSQRAATPNHLLKQARERKCWSQEHLAELVGTSRVNVSRWEQGHTIPGPHFREQLCAIFETAPAGLGLLPASIGGRGEAGAPKSGDATSPLLPSPPLFTPSPSDGPSMFEPVPTPVPPSATQELVGRSEILTHLKQQLRASSPPMVALYGLPGVGKTALATALAYDAQLRQHFSDGVLWVGVGREPNVLSLLAAWGTSVGLTATDTMRLLDAEVLGTHLRAAIGARRFLLIIDDAWTVEDALAFKVGGLHCAYLVTTRFPAVAVSLAGDAAVGVTELSEDDGLFLLTRLAPGILISFPHDAHILEDARALVHCVGALPLALSLIGRYLRVQAHSNQPRRIRTALERLRDAETRLRLEEHVAPVDRAPSWPSGGTVSVQAAIQISEQRLTHEESATLHALAVFPPKPSSFSEAAALSVCAVPPERLDALVDAGLLEGAAPGRYTLHQTIADVAASALTDRQRAVAARHLADFFVAYAEAHRANYAALDLEVSNIIAALRVTDDQGLEGYLIRGATALAPFLQARGLYTQALEYLEHAYQATSARERTATHAHICLHLGRTLELSGNLVRAEAVYQEGLSCARMVNDSDTLIAILAYWGELALNQGDYAHARTHLEEGVRLARTRGERRGLAVLLRLLGEVTDSQGDYQQATKLYQEGLALARAAEDHEAVSALLQDLGVKAMRRADLRLAQDLYSEGLAHARLIGHRQRISALLNNLGYIAFLRGRYVEAEAYYQDSLALARIIGHRLRISSALQNLGSLKTEQGEIVQAEAYLRESLESAHAIGNPFLSSETLNEWGKLCIRERRLDEAADKFHQALALARQVNLGLFTAGALYGLARIAVIQGDADYAAQLGQESLTYLDSEDVQEAADIARWLAALPTARPTRRQPQRTRSARRTAAEAVRALGGRSGAEW